MRPAFHDFARDLDVGHIWFVTFFLLSTSGIEARTAALRKLLVLLIPVRGPLPDVARHVVESIAVGWKTLHWRSALEAILFQVLPREFALPGIRHLFTIRCKRIAPNEFRTV